jgi:hypothetical protein
MIISQRSSAIEQAYRYGFNGQEKVDEISGNGNHTTATFWEYDSRLVRRWNQDPKPNPSISNYAAFANNPIWFSDALGDTVKTEGFSEKKIMKDLGKGLDVKKGINPYSFDKKGNLRVDQKKFEALSEKQKGIAGNINEAIESDITFTITKAKTSQVLGKDANGNNITLWDVGGAATVGNPNDPENVRIWMDGVQLSGKDRPTDKNGTHLKTPTWLSLYHELGGHGVHRYIRKESRAEQNTNTVEYENLVRKIHGLGKREKHD